LTPSRAISSDLTLVASRRLVTRFFAFRALLHAGEIRIPFMGNHCGETNARIRRVHKEKGYD
jgi:hypothetical protein